MFEVVNFYFIIKKKNLNKYKKKKEVNYYLLKYC